MWYGAAIAACAAGMLSKQVMVTAPIIVLLYDFMFQGGSIKDALAKRWVLYAGLAATWALLAVIMIAAPASETAGFGLRSTSSWEYCRSEFIVIAYYVRLSLWPGPLCFDYFGWPKAQTAAQVAPYAVVVSALAAGTLWLVVRRKPAGFLSAWFFLVLLPTSSLLPIQDPIYEHRMYLPLASVVAFLVLGCYLLGVRALDRLPVVIQHKEACKRIGLALVTLIVAILGVATARRNVDYSSEIAMWADVVRKRPDNARGHNNLGSIFLNHGRTQDAMDEFAEAIRVSPTYAYAHYNLGAALITLGNLDQAKLHLIEALRLNPQDHRAHFNLGAILGVQGQTDGAIQEFARTLQIKPDFVEAYQQLGVALENEGRVSEAKEQYRIALHLRPEWRELEEHVAGLQ
jgi:tetratricopeptide (TPR) repeat protein